VEKAVAWCQGKTGKELASSQQAALRQALSSRALIITGGPGVGKTTLVNAILLMLRAKKVRCCCALLQAELQSGYGRQPGWRQKPSTVCWK
jgi:exodeoxyribonuclease V alpha subunit